MRAAIYTRYSTDKQSQASTADQRRKCEARAAVEGWQVVEHFADEAMSGARADRPGYRALLAAAAAGRFEVIVVEGLDRLSRDSVESESAVRDLEFRGVRLVGVADGYDSKSGKGRKLLRGIRGLMNEAYLDDLREKTHRGLEGSALRGSHTGGRAYGYRHVAVEDPTKRDHLGRPIVVAVRREVDEAQAAVVRRIFKLYAEGRTSRAIALLLNEEGIPSPGSTWARNRPSKGWAASAIAGPSEGTGILNNELYIGRVVWNRRQWVKDPATGRRVPRDRDAAEWVATEVPELRIVDQATWDRVKRRQHEVELAIGARVRAGLSAASASRLGRPPAYLFSGMLRCASCGSNFTIAGQGKWTRYRCASQSNGREHQCTNRLGVRREVVERALLESIKAELLAPAIVEDVIRRARERVREAEAAPSPDAKRIAALEAEIGRLVDAVATGVLAPSPAVRERQERAEAELARLRAVAVAPLAKVERALPKLAEQYRELVANMAEVARADVAKARASLRRLLGDVVTLRPSESGEYLEAVLADSREALLGLAAKSLNIKDEILLVAGEGFEPSTFGL